MTFDVAQVPPNFPAQPLDARVEIQLNNAWTDISPYVLIDTTQVGWGHPDESTTAVSSTFAGTLDNSDGRFSQLNPLGPYYGSLGLNTPIRLSLPNGSSYLRSESDTLSNAIGTGTGSANVTNAPGFEVWVDADLDNWATPTVLASKWNAGTNQRSWSLQLPGDGTMQFLVSTDGTFNNGSAIFYYGTKLPILHGRMTVRVKYDIANSACSFWAQVGGGTGTWTNITGQCAGYTQGQTVLIPNPPLALPFASTQAVEVGRCSSFDFGETGFNGKIYAMALINAVAGTVSSALVSPDWTQATAGAASVTDAQGFVWPQNGTCEISNRDYRFHGKVSAWPQTWTPGGANALVPFSSAGLLRALGVTSATVQSPLRRAYSRLSGVGTIPWGYWPCEDGTAATVAGAASPGTAAAVWSLAAPQVASSSVFLCSQALPVLNGAALTCIVPKYPSQLNVASSAIGGAAVVRFLMDVPVAGDTNNSVVASVYYDNTSTVARIDLIYLSTGAMTLTAYNQSNTQLWTTGPVGFGMNGVPARVSIETQNVTTTTYNAAIVMQSADHSGNQGWFYAPGTNSTTGISGSIGNVTRVVMNPPGSGALLTTAIGHISVQSVFTSLYNMQLALQAYAGENAGTRFQRLCGEEGIQFRGIGNMADTTPMGVQSMETIVTLLQECVDADMGMWYETRPCLGFGYRNRVSIGNQTTYLALDYNVDHLTDDLAPTHDDQTVKNDVTVTNQQSGSTAEILLNDGSPLALNTIGRYDLSATINLQLDGQNIHAAGWLLHTKTVNEPRYTAINVDLANRTINSLWYQITGVSPGDRVVIANPPAWLPPDQIDQVIQGGTERFSLKDLYESWNGIPTTPWNVASYADTVLGRGDTDGSTLVQSAPIGDTTLQVAPTGSSGMPWTVCGLDFPFDVKIAGERVTVNSCYGPGLFDGSFELNLGTTEFGSTNATLTSATNQHAEGSRSLQVTSIATGGFNTLTAATSRAIVVPGQTYTWTSMVMMGTSSGGILPNMFINWYDSGGNFLSTTSGTNPVGNATFIWYPMYITATAPANAAFAGIGMGATAGTAGNYFYVDSIYPVLGECQPNVSAGLPDGTFESGVAGWTCTGGTVTQSSTQKHSGSFSAQCVSVGSPSQMILRPTNPGQLAYVMPGSSYTAMMWVWCGGAVTISAAIDWRNASGSLVGGPSTASFPITGATWTPIQVSGICPAGASQAGYGFTIASPVTGTTIYLDDVLLIGPGQTMNVTRAVNGVTKAQAPGADVRLFFTPVYSF